MGWAHCGQDNKGREIGYAIEAICDEPGCTVEIDRGLAYACGGMHGIGGMRGDVGCEGYFCAEHLLISRLTKDWICNSCYSEKVHSL